MNRPERLFHVRCDVFALREAQRSPDVVFERCLKTYVVDAEGKAHHEGSPVLGVDMENKIVTFPQGGSLPLGNPGVSCGLYTTSRAEAFLFFRGLATGFRDGFHDCHTQVTNRVSRMSPGDPQTTMASPGTEG